MFEEEKELKLLLKEESYLKLMDLFPKEVKILHQINHYFDTPELYFHRCEITIRIRQENELCFFTLKRRLSVEENLTTSSEFNLPISGVESIKPILDPSLAMEFFSSIPGMGQEELNQAQKLVYLGALINERSRRKGPMDLELELDKSLYPSGKTEYEMEVEGIGAHQISSLLHFLDEKNLPYNLPKGGKRSRFLLDIGKNPA